MDYYSTLGVSKNASDKELKSAYKKLSMQHHPDRTGGDDAKFKVKNKISPVLTEVPPENVPNLPVKIAKIP